MKRGSVVLRASLVAAALAACSGDTRPLTQIVVAVDSDWDGFDHVDIEISGFDKPTTVHTGDLKSHPLPRRFAIVHDGGPPGPIAVTARAYVGTAKDAVLVEPRTNIYFVKGQTRLLQIDLLLKCIGRCIAGQACVAGPACESSDDAARLTGWDGDINAVKTKYHVRDGDVLGDAGSDAAPAGDSAVDGSAGSGSGGHGSGGHGSGGHGSGGKGGGATDAGDASAEDAGDSGMPVKPPFTPSNIDPSDPAIAAVSPVAVTLNCASPTFDSTDSSFTGWCGDMPPAVLVQQDATHDAVVLVMSSLDIGSPATLRLQGSKPIILLVFGMVSIDGVIDASARGTAPGPGAERDCATGIGANGHDGSGLSVASDGGGGGGFGSAGGSGGPSNGNSNSNAGGGVEGNLKLTPLRGGCAGGNGGAPSVSSAFASGGAGGGAVQISASGPVTISGAVIAVGGGGGVASNGQSGGGGGGSGGAILIEGSSVALDSAAVISVNGGGGGAGQPYSDTKSTAGEDGHAALSAAAGGTMSGTGGAGGAGAWRDADAGNGGKPGQLAGFYGGGGGGGGGSGRIRIDGAPTCAPNGMFTPLPAFVCKTCGACPDPAPPGCTSARHLGIDYLVCSVSTSWTAARDRCISAGMHLEHVNDMSENTWVTSQLAAETWIGGSDSVTEDDWRWVDDGTAFWSGDESGSPIGYAPFASGEPNDSPAPQDCATTSTDGLWRDRNCDTDAYPYVCEHAP